MRLELITLVSIVLLSTVPKMAYAELLSFECLFTEYSDNRGKHQYSKAHSFKISWDKNSKKAAQRFKSREVTYRVVDGHDMVSFIHSETNGNVIVTSIAKINGHAVHSRNVFGISLQSYGQCQID